MEILFLLAKSVQYYHTGNENTRNHQWGYIVSMQHQILTSDIKRILCHPFVRFSILSLSVKRVYFSQLGMGAKVSDSRSSSFIESWGAPLLAVETTISLRGIRSCSSMQQILYGWSLECWCWASVSTLILPALSFKLLFLTFMFIQRAEISPACTGIPDFLYIFASFLFNFYWGFLLHQLTNLTCKD